MPTPKASATTPHRGAGHALFLLKLSRPYFWLVTFWLYLLPTGRRFDLLSSGWFWCGFAYSTLPLNLLCYLMNDLADVAVDRDNPRKGGALLGIRAQLPALRSAVGWCSAVQVPFLLAFAYSFGAVRCALWFAGVFAVNWLYNFGPRLSSNYAPLDLICPCGYMLVIPLRRAASPALWPRCAAPPATASAPSRRPSPCVPSPTQLLAQPPAAAAGSRVGAHGLLRRADAAVDPDVRPRDRRALRAKDDRRRARRRDGAGGPRGAAFAGGDDATTPARAHSHSHATPTHTRAP